jgi:N-acetylglucosamine kinase-like BadF-type ATPase
VIKITAVRYYLGIDGGGTKTLCAVGDESKLLATATALAKRKPASRCINPCVRPAPPQE